jgi:hypothetical protein
MSDTGALVSNTCSRRIETLRVLLRGLSSRQAVSSETGLIRNARFIAIYELASNEAIESLLQGPKYGAKARVQTMGKGSASLVVDSHVERLIPPTQAGRSGQPCVGDRSQCILAFQYHHLAKGSERDWMAVVILGPKSAVRQNDMTEALACSRRTTSKDALIRNTYQRGKMRSNARKVGHEPFE